MGKIVLLISFLLTMGCNVTVSAQCDSDSIIYKLTLSAYSQSADNDNGRARRYLTIDYKPIDPDLWGIIHIKDVDIDSIMVKEMFRISDTLSINYHMSHLNRMYHDDPEVIIVNEEDYVEKKLARAKNFWKRFWKIYPESGGLMSVSSIVYNSNCTEAVFYFENVTQWLVGGGFLAICYFEEEWKVKDIIGVLQM